MSNFTRTGALILALGLVLGLSALGYLLGSGALSLRSMERTVTVKGLSEREVEADVATWPLTFQVASNDLDEIYKTIESRSGVIRDFLIDYGIADEDIILSPPDVTDVYAQQWGEHVGYIRRRQDRKSTRLNSSHVAISYAVFCLKKKKKRHVVN